MTPIVLTKIVQTSIAFPSQWNAWDGDGQYYYMRYRSGYGTIHAEPSEDINTWSYPANPVATFEGTDELDGVIELEDFCQRAGITIAPHAERIDHDEYLTELTRAVFNQTENEGER